jgi:hypothetical protein
MMFLFPREYFNVKKVDEAFSTQFSHFQSAGFATAVISLDALVVGKTEIYPLPTSPGKVVYRGWMLTDDRYLQLVNFIKSFGLEVFTSAEEYLATHYLPNWYPVIRDLTPETHFFSIDDDLEAALKGLGWERFFIKDYVKSLKTSIGAIVSEPEAIVTVVAEMQKFRGGIEGGICVRRVEDFIPATEKRYFVIDGKPFAASADEEIPEIVKECAKRISSKFFSVDVVIREGDGCQRIVEVGDGQVSDLVGWSVDRFTSLWMEYR